MEILASIVGKVFELTVEPVVRQVDYVRSLKKNVIKLERQIEILKESRENVDRMIFYARRNVEDIKPNVEKWMTEVDAMIKKCEGILQRNEGEQVRLCLNLVERHQLSRKAVKMGKHVLEMKNEGNFDRVSYHEVEIENQITKISPDFIDFESRKSIIQKILNVLAVNHYVNKIGIYGMGGVGKTMTVKEISRQVIEKKLFDEVVISTISQTPNLKEIQAELAEKLGLKLEEDHTVSGRALKLCKRLKMQKRCLVVLDDIWTHIDLERIGIPSSCNILLTSRDKHIFSNDMCIDTTFKIQLLHENESWSMFKTIAGEMIEEEFELKHLAPKIVMECAKLPIAIVTVAKALRNKPTSIWKDALNQLRHPVAMSIRGMNEKVFSSLTLSYDQVKSEEAKLLFLLCSLFLKDSSIHVKSLQGYAMSLGLLHGVQNVAQGRDRVTKLIDNLISSSLLQKAGNNVVKMHIQVHNVATLIASKDEKMCTLSYMKRANEMGVVEVSGNYTAIYLNVRDHTGLPQKLILPKVQLLILNGLQNSLELPITLFEEMKELKVLEVQHQKFSLLPSSPHCLTNLRSLGLLSCDVRNIDMISELKNLEILHIVGSLINQIPTGLSQLTCLKVLNLSHCETLDFLPPNILSNLTQLEELNLATYDGWESEREELNTERRNASLSELKNLSSLSCLCLRILNEEAIPRQMFSEEMNLETFEIFIGSPYEIVHNAPRRLHLKMKSEEHMNDGIKMLIKKSVHLLLEGSIGSNVFLSGLVDESDPPHIKHLNLRYMDELQHVFDEHTQPLRKALSNNLMHLSLRGLGNLEGVIHGHDRESPFNKLKVVTVIQCKKLRSLFFNSIVDELSSLIEIEIVNCEMLQVLTTMANEESNGKTWFAHLRSLSLDGIPELKSLASTRHEFEQLSLENSSTLNNNSLFSEVVSLPNLVKLRIKGCDNLKTICENTVFPNSFSKLVEVHISSCNNLVKVFSSRIMSLLTCLEVLRIENCNSLEAVFEEQESNITREIAVLLPLKRLELSNLPNLRYVWSEDPSELKAFENMKVLSISQCPKFRKDCNINIVGPQVNQLDSEMPLQNMVLENQMITEQHLEKSKSDPSSSHTSNEIPIDSRVYLDSLQNFAWDDNKYLRNASERLSLRNLPGLPFSKKEEYE